MREKSYYNGRSRTRNRGGGGVRGYDIGLKSNDTPVWIHAR